MHFPPFRSLIRNSFFALQEERADRLTALVTKLEEEARKRDSELAEARAQREDMEFKMEEESIMRSENEAEGKTQMVDKIRGGAKSIENARP